MRRIAPLALLLLPLAGCTEAPRASAEGLRSMREAADRGEAAFGVPADLVLALAWAETRWTTPEATDHDHGAPTLGVAGLRADLSIDPLSVVADRLSVPRSEVELRMTEPAFATLASAAVLGALADARGVAPSDDPAAWRDVLSDYLALDGALGREHAEHVLDVLRRGVGGETATGETLVLAPREIAGPPGDGVALAYGGVEYPGAIWSPASTANYTSGRAGHSIRYVIIHTTQGSYAGAISWFRNPSASVSAHYVIRSSDGEVTQMLHHGDTGWHAGNWTYNTESIGIEHEGYVADPGRWYTDAMYRSSAALTRHLCDTYGIPIDRAHIIGHFEVPGATHTDPGSGWDWDRYMALVRGEPPGPAFDATAGATNVPAEMTSGDRAVAWVEFTNTGSSAWDIDPTRLGTSSPEDHASPFYDVENWLNDHRASGADHSYAPGAVGRFTFMVHAPEVTSDTTITDTFRLVQEGVTWFGPEVTLSILVHPRPTSGPVDGDGDGSTSDVDCDDADALRFPGAEEACGDGIDQDCDGNDVPCPSGDAGPTIPRYDAGPRPPGTDAGPAIRREPGSLSGGCGCTAGARPSPSSFAIAPLLLALALRRRERALRR